MKLIEKLNYTTKSYKYIEKRLAARGIALDGNKVLLIHVKKDDTYTFPGGGLDVDESLEEACIREMEEEAGAQGVEVIEEFGYIDETRDSRFTKDTAFNMISYYFLCKIDNLNGKMKLENYERELGFSAVWIDIRDALVHNKQVKDSVKFRFKKVRYLDRAIKILELLEGVVK
ncbi:NUDIX domain-containing protein [Mycoplasmatota bacterium]|nr:NUDIX domain-containing protein [Mycoplasmatota bacterium]